MTRNRIRVATPSDAATMAELHKPSFAEPWPAEAFASLLAREEIIGLIGALGHSDQGLIVVRAAADEAEILTLCVEDSVRRKRLGRDLVEAACEAARLRGVARMFLEVAENNQAARALYGNLGFTAVGRRPAYYRNGDAAADALVLRRDLAAARPKES
jgi:ribosomal-protein-alanine N-acetyltransferase